MLALAVVYAALWLLLRDATASWRGQFGELLGAEAVLALTVSAVTAARSSRMDAAFRGPERRQRWHRATAVAGLGLVFAHLPVVVPVSANRVGSALGAVSLLLFLALIALALLTPSGWFGRWRGPIGWIARLPYDRWTAIHRLTAVALLAGMGHGLLDSAALAHQPALSVVYLAICLIGTAALAYQLILRRYVLRGSRYRVQDIRRLTTDVKAITLRPEAKPWAPAPGQYIEVSFTGIRHGAHPFSVVHTHPDGTIQIAVKAGGNDTRAIHKKVQAGTRARVHRPRGDFDYRGAGERQIWIAAGIGITPFLSWIPSLSQGPERVVDLWYTVRSPDEAPFLAEVNAAARANPWLHLHLVFTQNDGRISAQRILAGGAVGREAAAFVCGPPAMIRTLTRELRTLGLAGPIVHEAFSAR